MKIEQQKSELMKEKRQKALLLGLSGVLLGITFLQSIANLSLLHYAHSKHETHFLPLQVSGAFSLSASGVSEGYLRDMTNFLSQLRFNVNASSVNAQFNALLVYTAPSLYGELRAQLIQEIEAINHDHLSSVFYPINFEVDNKHLSVKVSGQMRRLVGRESMSDKHETFLMNYSYENGLLKLTNLEKVKA
jgi:conjugal transfer pilus assembly protein TraE